MIAFKSQKRQRDQQRKQKITENRKHLANVRVVQKNLVFVVGLPPRLADADVCWFCAIDNRQHNPLTIAVSDIKETRVFR